jgi:hypothetical protein
MREENRDPSPHFHESRLNGKKGNLSLGLSYVFESVMPKASLMMGENFHQ